MFTPQTAYANLSSSLLNQRMIEINERFEEPANWGVFNEQLFGVFQLAVNPVEESEAFQKEGGIKALASEIEKYGWHVTIFTASEWHTLFVSDGEIKAGVEPLEAAYVLASHHLQCDVLSGEPADDTDLDDLETIIMEMNPAVSEAEVEFEPEAEVEAETPAPITADEARRDAQLYFLVNKAACTEQNFEKFVSDGVASFKVDNESADSQSVDAYHAHLKTLALSYIGSLRAAAGVTVNGEAAEAEAEAEAEPETELPPLLQAVLDILVHREMLIDTEAAKDSVGVFVDGENDNGEPVTLHLVFTVGNRLIAGRSYPVICVRDADNQIPPREFLNTLKVSTFLDLIAV